VKVAALNAESLATHLDLLCGFFAGRIKNNRRVRQMGSDIQHECGLSDSGITAEENQSPCHGAAAENTVEFDDSRRYTRHLDACDFSKSNRCRIPRHRRVGRSRTDSFFNECVPLLTGRTTADPFRRGMAALLASVLSFRLHSKLRR
jgi:hypothetical protein